MAGERTGVPLPLCGVGQTGPAVRPGLGYRLWWLGLTPGHRKAARCLRVAGTAARTRRIDSIEDDEVIGSVYPTQQILPFARGRVSSYLFSDVEWQPDHRDAFWL